MPNRYCKKTVKSLNKTFFDIKKIYSPNNMIIKTISKINQNWMVKYNDYNRKSIFNQINIIEFEKLQPSIKSIGVKIK